MLGALVMVRSPSVMYTSPSLLLPPVTVKLLLKLVFVTAMIAASNPP